MLGSDPRSDRRPVLVLVYEYVTGGGLVGQELPGSWAVEGSAMRRVIAQDFASVPGVEVWMTLDARLPMEDYAGVLTRVVAIGEPRPLRSLSPEADFTLVIAPETDGTLAGSTLAVTQAGGRLLGSSPRAISLTGDKARLAQHFRNARIPTPDTMTIGPMSDEPLAYWEGPIVVKPRFGAGAVDTFVVRDSRWRDWLPRTQMMVVQPYIQGKPMSASFLVDMTGQATLIGVGRQRIEIDPEGLISYRGGTILEDVHEAPKVVEAAIASVNDSLGVHGLRGYIGVDYLEDPAGGITVLEINPRPTTSYVGLARLLGPGMIASAWLAAIDRPLAETEWPGWFRDLRQGLDVSFDADGTIVSED